MAGNEPGSSSAPRKSSSRQFTETRWSKVLLASQGESGLAMQAMDDLCATYWPPIYSFLRRKGYTSHDSEDLTQQFFVRLLSSNAFSRADPAKGRFRSFLLGSLKHFLVDEIRKASTRKRGAEISISGSEFEAAEKIYLQEPDRSLTPEQLYDRRWSETLLDLAFQRLRADYVDAHQQNRFKLLKSFLSEEPRSGEYERRGRELGMTSKAFAMAVSRMRQRYRQLVRSIVADTLAEADDIDSELHDLFS